MGRVIPIFIILFTLVSGAIYVLNREPAISAPPAVIKDVPKPVDCSFSDNRLIGQINSVRDNDVVVSPILEKAAQSRADSIPYTLDEHVGFRKMVSSGYFDRFTFVGEILASDDCASDSRLFYLWRNSPSHWSAINNERYDYVGVGYNSKGIGVVIFGDLP